MSNMLEQAILDAKTLREAAIKNAESAIIEKYSGEVKEAIESLLEVEEDVFGGEPGGELGAGAPEETPDESSAMEQVPMAHLADEEDEVVVVDLDDIMAAAEEEPEDDAEDLEIDRDELADEIGINLNDDEPANRSDEIDINESDLVNLFKEMLTVDVPEIEVERSEEQTEEEEHQEVEEKELVNTDGMKEDDIEEYYRTMAKYESLQKENKNLKKIINTLKNTLQETNLANARLLYTNRVLSTPSLNEQQKTKIVDMVQSSRSVEEAKTIYETLQKTMAGDTSRKTSTQSLSEAVSKPSSIILGSRRQESKTAENPTINRWATLAGLKNK